MRRHPNQEAHSCGWCVKYDTLSEAQERVSFGCILTVGKGRKNLLLEDEPFRIELRGIFKVMVYTGPAGYRSQATATLVKRHVPLIAQELHLARTWCKRAEDDDKPIPTPEAILNESPELDELCTAAVIQAEVIKAQAWPSDSPRRRRPPRPRQSAIKILADLLRYDQDTIEQYAKPRLKPRKP